MSITQVRDAGPGGYVRSVRYVGLLTRAIAFAIDAALINLVAVVVSGGVTLIVSILHLPKGLRTVLLATGGAVYVLWTIGYFVVFWSTTGQTPGARAMRFKVVTAAGQGLKPRRAFVRCIGLVLAALPVFAGYLMILFDRRRRGLQDRVSRTLVVDAPRLLLPARRSSDSGDDRRASVPHAGGEHGGFTPDVADISAGR